MEIIKRVLTGKEAKRFYWTTFAGFCGLALVALAEVDASWTPVVIALVAGFTKEVNKRYL